MTTVPPIRSPGVITQEFHTPRDVRRGVIAGVAGNEQIGAHFFPAHDPIASRSGAPLAPAPAVSFAATLMLPQVAPHRLTHESQAAWPR